MAIEIVRFEPKHLEPVIALAERVWNRPRSRSFYEWRYLECAPFHEMMLALAEGECLAVVSAFHRTCLVHGVPTPCLETCDWCCRPDKIGLGLGSRVMRALTGFGLPIISFGGTEATRAILPGLGWKTPVNAGRYELPLSGRLLAAAAARRTRIPAGLLRWPLSVATRLWFQPRSGPGPEDGRVEFPPALGEEILPLYKDAAACGLLPLPSLPTLRWMAAGYPGVGRYLPMRFVQSGTLVGWALGRIYHDARGTAGALVDLYTPRDDVETYAWMVGAACSTLASYGPERIVVAATLPSLCEALRLRRFVRRGVVPVQCWRRGTDEFRQPIHVTLNCGDDAFVPYSGPGFGG